MAPLLLLACARVPPDLSPAGEPAYRTDDGWQMKLRHFPAQGPPVVLVHGMGTNHNNWDFREEVSLAAYLQARGWDVWVPELRGDDDTTPPSGDAARNYSFDDHARRDLPAAIDAVLAETGAEQVYWVGHSMGGMLLYTSLTLFPEKIAAGVAIAAPARFEAKSGWIRAARVGGYLMPNRGVMHNEAIYTALRPFGRANPIYGILLNRQNADWTLIKSIGEAGLEDMSRVTVDQVHMWLRTERFLDVEGESWLQPADVPVLLLSGSLDKVAPSENVAAACEVYTDCEYRLLEGYGHVDPVVGSSARAEVYPLIEGWLSEQRLSSELPPGLAGDPELP